MMAITHLGQKITRNYGLLKMYIADILGSVIASEREREREREEDWWVSNEILLRFFIEVYYETASN